MFIVAVVEAANRYYLPCIRSQMRAYQGFLIGDKGSRKNGETQIYVNFFALGFVNSP